LIGLCYKLISQQLKNRISLLDYYKDKLQKKRGETMDRKPILGETVFWPNYSTFGVVIDPEFWAKEAKEDPNAVKAKVLARDKWCGLDLVPFFDEAIPRK
jgi:hypothetical protein